MRIVVTGATGNHGTSLLDVLAGEDRVTEIVGIARRIPEGPPPPKVSWHQADIGKDDLTRAFEGADAVVHLAWLIQPSRDEITTHGTNVIGTYRVAEACVGTGVKTLVHASSIGAYAPGPKDQPVDESHPVTGISSSFYSRHKAAAERILANYADQLRLVIIRPGLVFKREAAAEIRRLFIGPFFPNLLARPELLALIPAHPRLRVQAVHSDDVARAYALAVLDEDARGAYNIAADPVLDLRGKLPPVPDFVLHAAAWASWKLRLQPTPPGWVDLALNVPVMDTTRARTELGWQPRKSATEALEELLAGIRGEEGLNTPPLAPETSGPARSHEIATGLGRKNP